MRNIALFVILAVLTVAALVAWNVTSRRTAPQPTANVQPTPTVMAGPSPTPTPETGGALRRIFNGGLFGGGNTTPTPSQAPAATSSSTLGSLNPSMTPMPSVTVGPTPIGGYTKGGMAVSTPTPTLARVLGVNATSTPVPTSALQPTSTPQTSNVVMFREAGFSPDSITVKQGTVVRFINDSNQNMWIIADNSTFDMGQSVARNGVYEYRFTSTGEWFYHNKENGNQKGKVIVIN